MLQRIQTVYLLLAFICMVLLLVFPIFTVEVSFENSLEILTAEFGQRGLVSAAFPDGNFPFYIPLIALALFTLGSIFMYKNRKRQLLLSRLNLLLHILLVVAVYAFYYFGAGLIVDHYKDLGQEEVKVVFYMATGLFLLLPTIPFLILAIRGIKRDENLVKSLDRLR
jgi:hypothetical protein